MCDCVHRCSPESTNDEHVCEEDQDGTGEYRGTCLHMAIIAADSLIVNVSWMTDQIQHTLFVVRLSSFSLRIRSH